MLSKNTEKPWQTNRKRSGRLKVDAKSKDRLNILQNKQTKTFLLLSCAHIVNFNLIKCTTLTGSNALWLENNACWEKEAPCWFYLP